MNKIKNLYLYKWLPALEESIIVFKSMKPESSTYFLFCDTMSHLAYLDFGFHMNVSGKIFTSNMIVVIPIL